MKNLNRLFLVAYMLLWAGWATSKIGVTSCDSVTALGAWLFVFVIAGGAFLGWLVGKEV